MSDTADEPPRETKRAKLDDGAGASGSNSNLRPWARQRKILKEQDVGITEYVDPSVPGFNATIKERYSDFQVREIALDGTVCRITSLEPPAAVGEAEARKKADQEAKKEAMKKETEAQAGKDPNQWPDDASSKLSADGWTEAQIEAIQRLWTEKPAGNEKECVVSLAMADKAHRSKVHLTVREVFAGRFDTSTVNRAEAEKWATPPTLEAVRESAEDASFIVLQRRPNRATRSKMTHYRTFTDKSEQVDADKPPYIKFLLQKTNKDTGDALGILTRALGIAHGGGPVSRDFTTAGTKDKRGVTIQAVVLKRGKRTTLADFWQRTCTRPGEQKGGYKSGGKDDRFGIRVAHAEYASEPLRLGLLKGNEFVITLRNVHFADKTRVSSYENIDKSLQAAVEVIRTKGFINYYGMQRFGTSDIATHHIGAAILRKDFKEVIALIMSDRSGDGQEAQRAREFYRKGDYKRALEMMPRFNVAERGILGKILDKLKKNPEEKEITEWMVLLAGMPRNLQTMYVHSYQSYVWNRLVSLRLKMGHHPIVGDYVLLNGDLEGVEATEQADQPSSVGTKFAPPPVKILKEEDLKNCTLADILIPSPGADVHPEKDSWLNKAYESMIAEDGLKPEDLYNSSQITFQMTGVYRKMMGQAANVSARLIRYRDSNTDLAVSDEDELLGRKAPSDDPQGNFLAAQLTFQLGVSAYATMLLRELLKSDTSPESQKQMNTTTQVSAPAIKMESTTAAVTESTQAPAPQPAATENKCDIPMEMDIKTESTSSARDNAEASYAC